MTCFVDRQITNDIGGVSKAYDSDSEVWIDQLKFKQSKLCRLNPLHTGDFGYSSKEDISSRDVHLMLYDLPPVGIYRFYLMQPA